MKSIVVYYSLTGKTAAVAQQIAEALDAQTLCLEPVKAYTKNPFAKFFVGGRAALMAAKPELKPYSFDASSYDLIVLVTPVWASRFTPPFNTFFAENDISAKKVAFVATCDGGSTDEMFQNTEKVLPNVVATLRIAKPDQNKEATVASIADFAKKCQAAF